MIYKNHGSGAFLFLSSSGKWYALTSSALKAEEVATPASLSGCSAVKADTLSKRAKRAYQEIKNN